MPFEGDRHPERLAGFVRFLQSGRLQYYLMSIGLTLVVLLVWSAL